jgi:hypothetical protein
MHPLVAGLIFWGTMARTERADDRSGAYPAGLLWLAMACGAAGMVFMPYRWFRDERGQDNKEADHEH